MRVGAVADRLGHREVWAGEEPTWDAFAPATAISLATGHVALTAGPVLVSVLVSGRGSMPVSGRASRCDPVTIARGAASVAAVVGRLVGVAPGPPAGGSSKAYTGCPESGRRRRSRTARRPYGVS